MEEQKDKEAPKCDLKWDDGKFVVECETHEDRTRAVEALEDQDIIVRIKVKEEQN